MKFWLTLASVLVILGLILFIGVMAENGWDFSKLAMVKYESVTKEIDESFIGIYIEGDTEDVRILPSEDGKCRIEFYEADDERHSVEIKDGILTVSKKRNVKWYSRLFCFQRAKITLYLPSDMYESLTVDIATGDVDIKVGEKEKTGCVQIGGDTYFNNIKINVTTGDIYCSAYSLGNLEITATTGNVAVEKSRAKTLDITLTTGNASLNEVMYTEDVFIDRTTGDVKIKYSECRSLTLTGTTGKTEINGSYVHGRFESVCTTGNTYVSHFDASEIKIESTTGDVTASFYTEKIVYATATTGKIDVPKSTSGGLCEITTTTGDITVTIEE